MADQIKKIIPRFLWWIKIKRIIPVSILASFLVVINGTLFSLMFNYKARDTHLILNLIIWTSVVILSQIISVFIFRLFKIRIGYFDKHLTSLTFASSVALVYLI
jgi:hypothetical protein